MRVSLYLLGSLCVRVSGTEIVCVTRCPPRRAARALQNLPYKISSDELYDIFGKYGAIRQIRIGNAKDTKGTGFVVYEDILDAKNAVEHLTGFNVAGRYLTVLYYQPNKVTKKMDLEKKRQELEALKAKHGVDGSAPPPFKKQG